MSEQAKVVTTERQSAGFDLEVSPDNLKETDASEMSADKKTDEPEGKVVHLRVRSLRSPESKVTKVTVNLMVKG